MEETLNLNSAQCLKEQKGFTGTTVVNVCNGNVAYVPYGGLDFMLATILIVAVGTVIAIIIGLLLKIWFLDY